MGAKAVPWWKRHFSRVVAAKREAEAVSLGLRGNREWHPPAPQHRLPFALIPQLAIALMTPGLPDFLLERMEGL